MADDRNTIDHAIRLFPAMSSTEQLKKLIWNQAIEAAAQCVDQANRDGPYNAIIAARSIRLLLIP